MALSTGLPRCRLETMTALGFAAAAACCADPEAEEPAIAAAKDAAEGAAAIAAGNDCGGVGGAAEFGSGCARALVGVSRTADAGSDGGAGAVPAAAVGRDSTEGWNTDGSC
eukprot:scaffold9643_cov144-Isochrysis_galbana.AAC.2